MTLIFSLLKWFISLTLAFINIFGVHFSTCTVELYSNPASGYEWEYSVDEDGILALNSAKYTPDTASLLTGKGGGTQYFTFRAVNAGTVDITFEYVKYSDNKRLVASTYVYTYIVDKSGGIALYEVKR